MREKNFPSVKKTEKGPKMAFTGTFDFHGEKKTLFRSTTNFILRRVIASVAELVSPVPGFIITVKLFERNMTFTISLQARMTVAF